jgi:hypothetical protein
MTQNQIQVRRATLTITLPIVCEKCGTQGRTEAFKIEVEDTFLSNLAESIAHHARIGTNFPVGWAGYGT